MTGQMCWLPTPTGQKQLHLRTAPGTPWQHYASSPWKVPDYKIPGGSKGWATYQKLLKDGWTLLPSPQPESGESVA